MLRKRNMLILDRLIYFMKNLLLDHLNEYAKAPPPTYIFGKFIFMKVKGPW